MDARQYAVVVANLLAVLVALAVGLGIFAKPGVPTPEFVANEAKWRATGIAFYSITIQQFCECDTRPVRVTVRDNVVAGAYFTDALGPPTEVEREGRPLSIEQVFSRISDAYISRFDHVAASYDPIAGYPIEVVLDPWTDAVDDEVRYVLSEFEVINGG